jgi:sec-independent protein translocase protein TatB
MTHMIIVFIVVLVVFGPQKLPELARGLGKLMAEFRKASTDFRSAFEQEMRDLERQALDAERKKAADAAAAAAKASPQPAALATTTGVETSDSKQESDSNAAQAPVIAPVAESVPRASEENSSFTPETVQPVTAESTADPAHDH